MRHEFEELKERAVTGQPEELVSCPINNVAFAVGQLAVFRTRTTSSLDAIKGLIRNRHLENDPFSS